MVNHKCLAPYAFKQIFFLPNYCYTSSEELLDGGIVINGFQNTLIEHNVIDGGITDGIIYRGLAGGGTGYQTIVRNNIIINNGGFGISNEETSVNTFISNNNLVYNNEAGNYNNVTSTDDINSDPLFGTSHSTLNQWHHIVASYDNATETMKIYIDGVEKSSASYPGLFGTIGSNSFELYLGVYRGFAYFFDGRQDEVAIWNRALTTSEVSTLYNNGAPVNITGTVTSGLQAYFQMENNWNDSSGNVFNAEDSTASFTTDAINGTYAGLFNGVDAGVQYPNNLSTTNGLTISTWIYRTGLPEDIQTILAKGRESDNDHIWLYFMDESVIFELGNGTDRMDLEAYITNPEDLDYHVKSEFGRFDGSSWIMDTETSPCIDGGQALSDYINEPAPNGGVVNIGVYGNTTEASKSSVSSLPMELIDFYANKRNENVLLIWQTASEQNNDYFEIEHSPNAHDFKTIGKIKAQGTSLTNHKYSFIHKNADKGINYYRLRQIDFDGKYIYSSIVSIEIDKAKFSFHPNPASHTINLSQPCELVVIYDLMGKEILRKEHVESSLDLSEIKTGIYLFDVNHGEYTQRLIIENQ